MLTSPNSPNTSNLERHSTWNFKKLMLEEIAKNGGWVNSHAHIDRANTVTNGNFKLYSASLQEKWVLNDGLKRNSSVQDYYERMALVVEDMIQQGVVILGTNIDIDPVVQDKVIKAADKLRNNYKDKIKLVYSNQVHYGVLEKEARKWFDMAAEFVDIIGGLPEADGEKEAEHMDVILSTGKRYNKMVHSHVDQFHSPAQKQTELLAQKTIDFGMEGKVVGIHGLSLATKPTDYRKKTYKLMKEAGMMMICCPTAWLDIKRNEEMMPFHNAMLPVDELILENIPVAIGTDGIRDIYTPFIDGDMWIELRALAHACRITNLDELVKIATTNGRKVLGVD